MRGNIPLKEQTDTVTTQGTAILQQQPLVDTLTRKVLLSFHLSVEGLYQETVGFLLRHDRRVLGDELEQGTVIVAGDFRKSPA